MTIQRKRVQVKAARTYKKWDNWSEGDYIQGVFVGAVVDAFGKQNYGIQLTAISMANPVDDRGGELKEGMVLGLNHCGSLGYRMDGVAEGDEVEVVYTGKAALPANHKFKGKDCHTVDVFKLVADEELPEADI